MDATNLAQITINRSGLPLTKEGLRRGLAGPSIPSPAFLKILRSPNLLPKTNLIEAFAKVSDHWNPHIAGQVNDMHVKLVKLRGEFVWHHHQHEDEMFLVVKGNMLMKLRDGDVRIDEGEYIIVPRGVEHCPVAQSEAWVLLFEPASTLNTGNVKNERTVENPSHL